MYLAQNCGIPYQTWLKKNLEIIKDLDAKKIGAQFMRHCLIDTLILLLFRAAFTFEPKAFVRISSLSDFFLCQTLCFLALEQAKWGPNLRTTLTFPIFSPLPYPPSSCMGGSKTGNYGARLVNMTFNEQFLLYCLEFLLLFVKRKMNEFCTSGQIQIMLISQFSNYNGCLLNIY